MQNIEVGGHLFAARTEKAVSAPERLRRRIDSTLAPWVATLSPLIWFVLICVWLYTALCGLAGNNACR